MWSFYEVPIPVLFVTTVVLIFASSEAAYHFAQKADETERSDAGTLSAAALGLLALLLAFSFSIALGKYDSRREAVLDEALAIGSTANYAMALPSRERAPILALLRKYVQVRIALGVPYSPEKLQRDTTASVGLQSLLWQRATALGVAEPRSLPVAEFRESLNNLNNVHERRLTTLRVRVPVPVIVMLIATAMV